MQITLEEAATGCEKEIEIRKLDACEDLRWFRRSDRFQGGDLLDLPRSRPGGRFPGIFPGRPDLPDLPRHRPA